MIKLAWAGITVLLSLGRCDVATKYSISIPSAHSCKNIITDQIVRWDGRDDRTKLWLIAGTEVWDIDNEKLIMLDMDKWHCILDRKRSSVFYGG